MCLARVDAEIEQSVRNAIMADGQVIAYKIFQRSKKSYRGPYWRLSTYRKGMWCRANRQRISDADRLIRLPRDPDGRAPRPYLAGFHAFPTLVLARQYAISETFLPEDNFVCCKVILRDVTNTGAQYVGFGKDAKLIPTIVAQRMFIVEEVPLVPDRVCNV